MPLPRGRIEMRKYEQNKGREEEQVDRKWLWVQGYCYGLYEPILLSKCLLISLFFSHALLPGCPPANDRRDERGERAGMGAWKGGRVGVRGFVVDGRIHKWIKYKYHKHTWTQSVGVQKRLKTHKRIPILSILRHYQVPVHHPICSSLSVKGMIMRRNRNTCHSIDDYMHKTHICVCRKQTLNTHTLRHTQPKRARQFLVSHIVGLEPSVLRGYCEDVPCQEM
jgi:hypothetical protein